MPASGEHPSSKCHVPACGRPRPRSRPDIMIPFWQEDLCKLWYTARSIVVHDRSGYFGKIFLVWVSTHPASRYQSQVNQIVGMLKENHDAEVLDFSGQVELSAANGTSGWYAQQVLKLKIASKITSDFYVVMDAKNTILRDITGDEFITECNQGLIFGRYRHDEIPTPHLGWYALSAQALGVEAPKEGHWPPSITPMVIHRPTVLEMLASMHESSSLDTICAGPLCRMLGAGTSTGNGATEFTLYVLYATSQDTSGCIHRVIVPRDHDLAERWSVSLWRGQANHEKNLRRCRLTAHAEGMKLPLMFGAQTSSLDDLTDAQTDQVAAEISTVFERAELHGPSVSRDFVMKCVVGLPGVPPPIPPALNSSAGARPEAEIQVHEDYCCAVASDPSDLCGTCWPTARTTGDVGWCGLSEDHCAECGNTWCSAGRLKGGTFRASQPPSVSATKSLSTTALRSALATKSLSTTTSPSSLATKSLSPSALATKPLSTTTSPSALATMSLFTTTLTVNASQGEQEQQVQTTTGTLHDQDEGWLDRSAAAQANITVAVLFSAIMVTVALRCYVHYFQRCCACCVRRPADALQVPYETAFNLDEEPDAARMFAELEAVEHEGRSQQVRFAPGVSWQPRERML